MWSKSITELLENSGNADEKETIDQEVVQNGFKCRVVQKVTEQTREKMESHLRENLTNDQKYFNMCFKNPKKTIKDSLKVWNVIEENEDPQELIPTKFRFPVLRKYDFTTGVVEDKSTFMRPHSITTDSCKIIVIDHKRDLFVDVDQELKLLVFLWSDRNDNLNDLYFYQELSNFKEKCDDALKSMILDLSKVRSLPISYKPKLKRKYFELY